MLLSLKTGIVVVLAGVLSTSAVRATFTCPASDGLTQTSGCGNSYGVDCSYVLVAPGTSDSLVASGTACSFDACVDLCDDFTSCGLAAFNPTTSGCQLWDAGGADDLPHGSLDVAYLTAPVDQSPLCYSPDPSCTDLTAATSDNRDALYAAVLTCPAGDGYVVPAACGSQFQLYCGVSLGNEPVLLVPPVPQSSFLDCYTVCAEAAPACELAVYDPDSTLCSFYRLFVTKPPSTIVVASGSLFAAVVYQAATISNCATVALPTSTAAASTSSTSTSTSTSTTGCAKVTPLPKRSRRRNKIEV